MNTDAIVIDLARTLPRTRWYSSDAIPVIAFALVVISGLVSVVCGARDHIAWLRAVDDGLTARLQAVEPRSLPAASKLQNIQRTQPERDAVFAQRRSGLVLANELEAQGRALGKDALATKLDSAGAVEGFAPTYRTVSEIWRRLGSGYVLTSAEPAGGSVRFRIESTGPQQNPHLPSGSVRGAT